MPPRHEVPMDTYLLQEIPVMKWETWLFTMSRSKSIGQFKADVDAQLSDTWNKSWDKEEAVYNGDKITEHANMTAVINRQEKNREDSNTQITCRLNEWHIVAKCYRRSYQRRKK